MNILQTRHGLMMVRQGVDMISNILMQKGEYEWQVVMMCAALSGSFKEGCVLDIGAHFGTVTVPLARQNPQYTVHAFEPQPLIYYQLAGNIALNNLENVKAYNLALGHKKAKIKIDLPDYKTDKNLGAWTMDKMVREHSPEGTGGGQTVEVQMEALRNMTFDKPIRLIKMDVEGMEDKIIDGMGSLLEDHKYPPIVFESWQHYHWWVERAQSLDVKLSKGLGYTLYQDGLTKVAVHKKNELKVELRQANGQTSLEILNEF